MAAEENLSARRRSRAARAAVACALAMLGAAAQATGDDCAARLALAPAPPWQIDGDGYVVAFAARAQPIAVGRHFEVDFVVCPRPGVAPPTSVRIDADMPAHRHGMNYRASVEHLDSGVYRAKGLLFHMPGRWRFVFDLATAERSTRLVHEVEVP